MGFVVDNDRLAVDLYCAEDIDDLHWGIEPERLQVRAATICFCYIHCHRYIFFSLSNLIIVVLRVKLASSPPFSPSPSVMERGRPEAERREGVRCYNNPMPKAGQKLEKLVKIVERLRRECPWDREQTSASLKPYLVEEVYEALEAIDSKNYPQLAEELGDMLLHIVMLSVFAAEKGKFKIDQVIDLISAKMVRRHPHVFGRGKAKDKQEVWKKWEKIKQREKKNSGQKQAGLLDSVPRSLPALYRAEKIQRRAARVGFDWDQVAGAWDKVHEELDEVHQLLKNREEHKIDKAKVKEELGDLLFSIVNVTRKLEIDAEEVLQGANNKFIKRFSFIERALRKKELTIEEMDRLWRQAKRGEKPVL